MGFITNMPTKTVYQHDKMDDRQFQVDQSSVSKEDENMFITFASEAATHIKRIKPFPDFKTRNKSFLQLYKDLKRLGVKNNRFFLTLYDKDLQLIDPYAPNLPKDYQLKVYLECLINPWYFLREVLRIPADGKPIEIGGGVQYRIDRNNAAAWYCYLNGIDHYQSKPRQQGKTQDAISKFLYAYLFGTMSSTILFFNKDQDQANMNLYRMKCQRDMLPSYLQMRMIIDDNGKADRGIENIRTIRNPVNNNTVTTMGKATSKESAMKMGRGATAPLQYLDEFDFIPYQIEIMNAAAFAYSTAAKNAREYGSLYGRVLTSTPGDLDTKSGADATEYVGKMMIWEESFFDKDIDEIKAVLNSPAYNRFMFIEHSWQQLKLPMSWYEEQCSLVSFNEEVILREIGLQRIHGSSLSPFKRSDIMYIMSHKKTPIAEWDISKNLCPFKIYEKLKYSTPYLCCVDPAEGIGGDSSAVVFINPYTQQPAVEFRSPYVSQPDLFQMLCQFMDKYCPKCMIIIESNRGIELINCFLSSKYQPQLYYDDGKLLQTIEKMKANGQVYHSSAQRRATGFTTAGNNRNMLIRLLEVLMEEEKGILCTPNLVDDICALIKKPTTGRVEAGPGKHDDTVMAFLIGIFLYRNLTPERLEEYGIRKGMADDSDDYTEEGELTMEAKLRKMKEMLPGLPEQLRMLISGALNIRSEVDDINRATKEIQQARQAISRGALPSEDGFVRLDEADIRTQTAAPSDIAFWEQWDQSMTGGYESADQGSIDIEDLVD